MVVGGGDLYRLPVLIIIVVYIPLSVCFKPTQALPSCRLSRYRTRATTPAPPSSSVCRSNIRFYNEIVFFNCHLIAAIYVSSTSERTGWKTRPWRGLWGWDGR